MHSTVVVPNQFPPTARPIVILPTVEMSRKSLEANPGAKQTMMEEVCRIVAENFGVRQLVHTVSYDWTNELHGYLSRHFGPRSLYTYRDASQRSMAVENFRSSRNGILLAPSLERGIDLPQDACRVVIVTKIPFPFLGDKQIAARLYSKGGQSWYNTETIRSLIQMTGRGVRSADDFCASYILDKQFTANLWKKSRHLIPKWWQDAIVWDKTKIWW